MSQSNPWGITHAQARAMDALIRYESGKVAANVLGLTSAAFNDRIKRVKKHMGCTSHGVFTHILKWDRWRREQETASALRVSAALQAGELEAA